MKARSFLTLGVVAVFAAASVTGRDAASLPDGFRILPADELNWQSTEEFEGLKIALIEGDPAKPGIYVMRAKFAPGVFSRPHYHSSDRLVTVISGVWYAGTDASFDPDETVALHPGDFMKHPAGGVHYDGAKDVETVVEISGIGPVETTAVEIVN